MNILKETNMGDVRLVAYALLDIPLEESKVFPSLTSHPFTSSMFSMLPVDGKWEMVDLHDEGIQEEWRAFIKKQIEDADLMNIMMLMNPPYYLAFMKHAMPYLSSKDMAFLLHNFWERVEAITSDVNVSTADILNMFTYADKEPLMTKEEKEKLNSLPDMVTVYRGVTSHNKDKKKAFSWTLKRDVAVWFANRFQTGTGEIWTLEIPKKQIIAYFDNQEDEVIVNMQGYVSSIEKSPL